MPQGQGECVLLVDDEESILRATRHALEKNGYKVLTASDGGEGLTVYKQHAEEIRVVITDLMMPFVDGQTFLGDLRQINEQVCVVAISGRYEKSSPPEELRSVVQAFLCKPFGTDLLLETLDRVLHQPRTVS